MAKKNEASLGGRIEKVANGNHSETLHYFWNDSEPSRSLAARLNEAHKPDEETTGFVIAICDLSRRRIML